MPPFNGFFSSTGTLRQEMQEKHLLYQELASKYPQCFEKGLPLWDEIPQGSDVDKRLSTFEKERKESIQEHSFKGKGLAKLGTLLQLKGLPGSAEHRYWGDEIRSYVVGGRLGFSIETYNVFPDTFVLSYETLRPPRENPTPYNEAFGKDSKGVLKPGTWIQVKALPGGKNWECFGDAVRTFILGGIVGGEVDSLSDLAPDDVVLCYKNLVSG